MIIECDVGHSDWGHGVGIGLAMRQVRTSRGMGRHISIGRRTHEEGIDGLVGFMTCGTDERCLCLDGWECMVFLWFTDAVCEVSCF